MFLEWRIVKVRKKSFNFLFLFRIFAFQTRGYNMRTLIRLFFSIFGYNVYFVKRAQEKSNVEFCNQGHMDKLFGNEKSVADYDSKNRIKIFHEIATKYNVLLKESKPERIIDVGCGSGTLLKIIGAMYSFAQCYGYNFSSKAIEFSSENNPKAIFAKT